MNLSGKHVAITGASSGIGDALARELGKAGAKLTLVSRREDLLRTLGKECGGEVHIAAHDLADVDRATDWIKPAEEVLGPIDVLINNAGIQVIGKFWEQSDERLDSMFRVNLLTPMKLTKEVLPGMIARGEGTIVDISSKAALAGGSESLRGELRKTGVHVVTVYPGPIDTPMGRNGYAAYEESFSTRATPMGYVGPLARLVRRAIEKKRARVIYPRLYALARYFPNTTRYFLDHFTPAPRALKSGVDS
jgi:short-subunit dehydrogenase